MARILYGVQGTSHGHAMRAVTLARHFTQHDFLFVTSEDAARVLKGEFNVYESLNTTTKYKGYKTDVLATIYYGLKVMVKTGEQVDRLVRLAEDFKPDIVISDYEYFVPLMAKRMGLPCLSLDHQHVITMCEHDIPKERLFDFYLHGSSILMNFSKVSDYLVISFYQPPVRKCHKRIKVCPPILRNTVLEREPSRGEHVLVYQSCSIFPKFEPFLRASGKRCIIYGYNEDRTDGNLTFRKFSEPGLLDDLASCDYVICGGGHTLISEALYYGKPLLSLPVKLAFEQYINAMYVERLGYGENHDMLSLNEKMIPNFEAKVETYRKKVEAANFRGNEEVYGLIDDFLANRKLTKLG